ncbi:MAG: site-specific DNA-methyltransferase [Selenomonadaceae bacterium]|nr:site-specific DNA-methyltransferase [Selenomonadaceae bacterium]
MPRLEWIGKEKVVNHAKEVPFHVLERKYSFGEGKDGMVIHGDNLVALKSLLPEYEGRVKCIYIDPPYNTGNEGWVYNDNVNDPRIKKWLGEVVGKEGEDLSRHDKWLCMMYPRLRLLHRLLAQDGFIFISIDVFEYANLKCILDEIFGSTNFRNCIAVRRGIKNVQAQFEEVQALSLGHEYIYLYSKSSQSKLPKLNKNFDIEKGGKWDTFWRGTDRPTMRYEMFGQCPETGQWRWEKGRATKAAENYRQYLKETNEEISLDDYYLNHLMATNEKLDFVRKNESGTVQYYVAPKSGKLLSDNWMDILLSGSYAGFDTEKNVLLLNRIIDWVTDKDSIILDSFAGSGTTAHAVLNLNKKDGGNRKFILIEMMDYAETITAERVRRVISGYGEGKNAVPGTGGGFDFYEIGAPLMTAGVLNEEISPAKIRRYVWYMETHEPPMEGLGDEDFLGIFQQTAYYFHYLPGEATVLDGEYLATITEEAESYVIYADRCLLSDEFMAQNHILFKKIPRDIAVL